MKVGDIYEVGTCKNCQHEIEHQYWGGGGWLWVHTTTKMTDCRRTPQAVPLVSSVRKVSP